MIYGAFWRCRASPAPPWELTDAPLIFPFAMDEFAEALRLALVMPEAEQERRMRRMRQQIADNNISR
jgi:trehalose-6-phosphate synthase